MAFKRYKFVLNTSSCFLCLEDNLNVDSSANLFSLQSIFQYLNLELSKLRTLSTKPAETLNSTDVRVNLCESCGVISEEISKLYKSMQVIQMKMDYNFQLIQYKVKSSESKNGEYPNHFARSQEIEEKMSTIRHLKLVKELRRGLLNKCNLKMPNYQPRVSLEKPMDFIAQRPAPFVEMAMLADLQISSETKRKLASNTPHLEPLALSSSKSHSSLTVELHSIKQDPLLGEDIHIEDVWNGSEIEAGKQYDVKLEPEACVLNPPLLETENTAVAENGSKDFLFSNASMGQIQEIDLPKLKSRKSSSKYYQKDHATGMLCCKKCDKKFKEKSGLYMHYQAIHLHRRFKCNACNKMWKYQRDWAKHQKTCQQNLDKRLAKEQDARFKFVCEVCGKRWSTRKVLSSHRVIVHQNANRFSCEVCHKKFSSKRYLAKHKDAVHLGKKFTCEFCQRMFTITNRRKHEVLCERKIKANFEKN